MTSQRTTARARRAKEALTPAIIEIAARRVLPRRNNHRAIDSSALLAECEQFGVRTRGQFVRMLVRHRRALRLFDQAPLTPLDQRLFRVEYGDDFVRDRMRRHYLLSVEGLVRTALECEFGDDYVAFCQSRQRAQDESVGVQDDLTALG